MTDLGLFWGPPSLFRASCGLSRPLRSVSRSLPPPPLPFPATLASLRPFAGSPAPLASSPFPRLCVSITILLLYNKILASVRSKLSKQLTASAHSPSARFTSWAQPRCQRASNRGVTWPQVDLPTGNGQSRTSLSPGPAGVQTQDGRRRKVIYVLVAGHDIDVQAFEQRYTIVRSTCSGTRGSRWPRWPSTRTG